jgi:hypothetical protein
MNVPALPDDVASYTSAHAFASKHRVAVEASAQCVCFSCFARFKPAAITKWIDAQQTALCPKCGLDSVLGEASGSRIDDAFLRRLHIHIFSTPAPRRQAR